MHLTSRENLLPPPSLGMEATRPTKMFRVLENNPVVMDHLSTALGLTGSQLGWHDVYSLTDPDLLAFIPRPVFALLVIIPLTSAWRERHKAEDRDKG